MQFYGRNTSLTATHRALCNPKLFRSSHRSSAFICFERFENPKDGTRRNSRINLRNLSNAFGWARPPPVSRSLWPSEIELLPSFLVIYFFRRRSPAPFSLIFSSVVVLPVDLVVPLLVIYNTPVQICVYSLFSPSRWSCCASAPCAAG